MLCWFNQVTFSQHAHMQIVRHQATAFIKTEYRYRYWYWRRYFNEHRQQLCVFVFVCEANFNFRRLQIQWAISYAIMNSLRKKHRPFHTRNKNGFETIIRPGMRIKQPAWVIVCDMWSSFKLSVNKSNAVTSNELMFWLFKIFNSKPFISPHTAARHPSKWPKNCKEMAMERKMVHSNVLRLRWLYVLQTIRKVCPSISGNVWR